MQPIKISSRDSERGGEEYIWRGKQESSHRDHSLLGLSSLVKDLGIRFSERDRQQGKAVSGAVFRMEDLPRTRTGARGRIWEARWEAWWWSLCEMMGQVRRCGGTGGNGFVLVWQREEWGRA